MSMRDYPELKNVKIPAEQEQIMDIICDAWEECRACECPVDCKYSQYLPECRNLFTCTAVKYASKIIEAGYAPNKWIDVRDRLPKPETDVLVCAERKYCGGGFRQIITIAMYENGTIKEKDSCFLWDDIDEFGIYDEEEDCYRIPEGWWECHQYSDCYDNKIDDKVTHWMPIPTYKEKENG